MTTVTLSEPPIQPETRGFAYVPLVITPPLDPVAEFARLLISDSRQQRADLMHCPKLATAAVWRAHGLAHGQPFSHIDHDGNGPNVYVRRAGCVLPADYAERGNNVESLAAGSADPSVVFGALAGSSAHAAHLFGHGWFGHQRHFGIALAENEQAPYRWYWCVLIALCGDG